MKATITVKMDNAAFEDGQGPELARLLHSLADRIKVAYSVPVDLTLFIRDSNGNRVGQLTFEED